ncbi:LytTR family DNA-binding domain-containing protein [Flammeovirgaceae bacterium SG7u.111]|nr:LytTR family DNA-binding domain-containing protein [Flammeovirgaceae bacterium SG7u.132]WPO34841.1 LytTR family DNA-binding domain-containing protein [Flammeovirgaceae bacterium SG7u.111]
MPLKVVIVEDEPATARNLEYILQSIEPDIVVLVVLPSVAASVKWLQANQSQCALIFMDIRLSDGLSFEIFEKVKVDPPVIFLTAYNEYALQAFKANGIGYILKPYDEDEVEEALVKFKKLSISTPALQNYSELITLMENLKAGPSSFKKSFLVQHREKLLPLDVGKIAWFYTENELVYAYTSDHNKYIIDFTLEQLQQQLDPTHFFRVNRQFIVCRKAIQDIDFYFNGRLIVNTTPKSNEQILISKAKAPEFKVWMNA